MFTLIDRSHPCQADGALVLARENVERGYVVGHQPSSGSSNSACTVAAFSAAARLATIPGFHSGSMAMPSAAELAKGAMLSPTRPPHANPQ
jgi:hypothetical protein